MSLVRLRREIMMRASNLAAAAALAVATCFVGSAAVKAESSENTLSGRASWYGPGFQGRRTASGEAFNTNAPTAAHRTLPFGTKVRVVNKKNGRSVVVRINDRGPYAHGRIIDLSRAAAQAIGLAGISEVAIAQL
jgi:rare lipoprotein A